MENQALTFSPVAMSTKEIAPLVEKLHAHVLRDTRSLLTQVFDLQDNPNLDYEGIQGVTVIKDEHTGRISELLLDKRLTMTLVSGYNPKLRLRVIDRLEELEEQARNPTALTRADIQPLLDRISKLEEDNHRLESWADYAVEWIRYLDESDLQSLDVTGRIGRLVKEHHGYFMEVIDALTALEDRIDYIARLAPGRGKHRRVSEFLRKGPEPV